MDRLKTEATLLDTVEGCAGRAEEALGGEERSSKPLELVAAEEAVAGFIAVLNSPKPSEALLIFRNAGGGGFDANDFGGGFGTVSKKVPPLKGVDVICAAAGVDFCRVVWPNEAKGDVLACCLGGEAAEDVVMKFRLLNASSNPPNDEFCPPAGACMPPNELCLPCRGCGGDIFGCCGCG